MSGAAKWTGLLVWAGLAWPAAAAPAPASGLILFCSLQQTGGGPNGSFTRRLDMDLKAGRMQIADNTGTGFVPLQYPGALAGVDAGMITFAFASPSSSGRGSINRKTGAYAFTDGRIVLTGFCSAADGGGRQF